VKGHGTSQSRIRRMPCAVSFDRNVPVLHALTVVGLNVPWRYWCGNKSVRVTSGSWRDCDPAFLPELGLA
jgi:hypothetical protein